MRHFYSFLLLAVLSSIAGTNAWAYSFVADGIYYNITSSIDLTVEVTYETTSYNSYSGDVVIPATVEHGGKTYSVTSIGSRAFQSCTGLTSITIPEGVTEIKAYAFRECTSLASVSLSNTVTSLGSCAFYGCTSLTGVTIPSSVTFLDTYSFYCCWNLTDVTLSNNLNRIGTDPFYGCSKLKCTEYGNAYYLGSDVNPYFMLIKPTSEEITSCEINENCKIIHTYAFSFCRNLMSLTIPSGVIFVGEGITRTCTGLTSIVVASENGMYDSRNDCNAIIETATGALVAGCSSTVIPDGVTSIGFAAFAYCTGLKSITIPEGVTKIGSMAFDGCKGLKSVSLPNTLTFIGNAGFRDCTGLKSVMIPSSVTLIELGAFSNVKNIICSGYASNSWALNVNGVADGDFIYADAEKTQLTAYVGDGGNVIIPEGVTSIGKCAFMDCIEMTSISIPNTITEIGTAAFQGCMGLTDVSVPGSVTDLSQSMFYECTGLSHVSILEGVTSIGYMSFYGCAELESVSIPSSVTSIDSYAFYGCKNLKKVFNNSSLTFAKGGTSYGNVALYAVVVYSNFTEEDGFRIAEEDGKKILCEYVGTDTEIVLPEVDGIGLYAFHNCTEMKSITIPASVTTIGDYAFKCCTGLTSLYVNSLVPPTVGKNTFADIDMEQCELFIAKDFIGRFQGADYWNAFLKVEDNPYVTVEKKAVIYVVDGVEYQRDSVAVTANIVPVEAPTKEGYTFSGWSEIPATMPDNDVTVTGTFAINKYAVIYMVDGEEYRRDSVEYGATITLAENPTRESHDFSGWSGYPEDLTMPAGDVIITGAFQFNGLAGVVAPTIGDEYFDLTGKPLAQPQRGINLVRKADGTTRKIIVK